MSTLHNFDDIHELHTLRDWLRYAVSAFDEAQLVDVVKIVQRGHFSCASRLHSKRGQLRCASIGLTSAELCNAVLLHMYPHPICSKNYRAVEACPESIKEYPTHDEIRCCW